MGKLGATKRSINYHRVHRNTGISVSHVSRILRGLRRPSVKNLQLLSVELGVPMEKLAKQLQRAERIQQGIEEEMEG